MGNRSDLKKGNFLLARLLRVPYDSTNCIRFSGYALSSALLTEHPNRNTSFYQPALKISSDLFVLLLPQRNRIFKTPVMTGSLKQIYTKFQMEKYSSVSSVIVSYDLEWPDTE